MEPSWRKPAGVIALLIYLMLYAALVASFAGTLSSLPQPFMFIAYLVLGIAWLAPLKPLFLWMNTGHWSTRKLRK